MLLAPGILNRLQTLNGVHNEAIGATDSIKALTNDQTRLQSILDVTKEQTTQLETSFNENHQTIKTNMELLDARIKDLITRIDKLSPH
jgi:predicted  nucleic acid-binding Zn-ribbon protein